MAKWYPRAAPAGARLINDKRRYILATGPKKSTKTFSICQKLAKHLYSVNGAVAVIIVKRRSTGKVGAWTDLTQYVIENEFQREGRILPWVKRPAASSDVKMQLCSVRNAYGGVSYCHLWSLYRDEDAENVFKNTRFSFAYVCEADQFGSPSIFRAIADQLRVPGVPYDAHQLVMDCNPPEEGMEHWLAKVFPVDDDREEWEQGKDKEYRDSFAVHKFTLDDNPWISQKDKQDIRNGYKDDPDKEARYYYGKWVTTSTGSLCDGVFDPSRHVVGEANIMRPMNQWNVLLPHQGARRLATGWDLGNTCHSFHIGSPRWSKGEIVMDTIDELVSIDMEIPLSEFVARVVAKMDLWEAVMKARGAPKVEWNHWSDTSAFGFKASAETSEAALVMKYSDYRIMLRRVTKGRNSVDARIGMLKRMLSDDQVAISVACPATITMLKLIKEKHLYGDARYTGQGKKFSHPFDSLTYLISHEIPAALLTAQAGRSVGRTGLASCKY